MSKRLAFIVFIASVLVDIIYSKTCRKVSCSDSLANECAVANTTSTVLKECSNKTVGCQYTLNELLTDAVGNYTCGEKKSPFEFPKTRYPGEACDDTNKCVVAGSSCANSTCTGKNVNETCLATQECVAGLYCAGTAGCQKQVVVGGNCTASTDCVNTAGCYEGKCTKYLKFLMF